MSSQESCAPSQSQGTTGKRRRRSAPPPSRLSWPGGLTSTQSTSLSQSAISSKNARSKSRSRGKNNKRQKTLLSAFNGKDQNDDGLLWTDLYAPTNRKELCVAPKKTQEVATWLEEGHEKLLVLVGRPGIGKSTMVHVLAKENKMEVLQWNDSFSTWSSHVESLSPLNSFAQFLQQSGVGFSSLQLQSASIDSQSAPSQKRLILLEELPNLANTESQERFRQLLTSHVQNSQIKTIWIYSDGTEGSSKPQDLERHVEPGVLYARSKIMQINPATRSQIKKSLDRIAKAEKFSINKDFCERMHLQSGGDVRYAIMSLQFDQAGRSKRNSSTYEEQPEHLRDTQWTAFHALGKILYAKREPVENSMANDSDERPPLAFDPEGVLEHCDLDLGNTLTYIGFHSADFFTDVEELSTAFDLFSDASYLLEQTTNYSYSRRRNNNSYNTAVSCPIFPEGYVSSLAGRSMAYANRHPAPSRFRQLQAPKIYDIRRKKTENANQLGQLQHRLSRLSLAGDLAATARATSSSMPPFVMDRLPFLRQIAPDAVNASLDQLHTSASEYGGRFSNEEDEAATAARLEQEQKEILQMDDIVDYGSNEEEDIDGRIETNIEAGSKQLPAAPVPNETTQNTLASEGKGAENDLGRKQQQQPTKPMRPIKRIANPYSRKKSSKTLSQHSNNVRRMASQGGTEIGWTRTSQPNKPLAKTEDAKSTEHVAVELKTKPVCKVVLMDV